MHITIAQRLRPFSHLPGTTVVIPGSNVRVQCFPAMLRIQDREIAIPVAGPATEFTVCQDLEAGCVRIWLQGPGGFLRYRIQVQANGQLILTCEKGAIESRELMMVPSPQATPCERLSLGSHRSLDWQRVLRDLDLHAILPVWLRLGQWVPPPPQIDFSGTAALLREVPTYAELKQLLAAGFEGLLSPRLTDDDHQGFHLPLVTATESPMALLTEGARILRSLFISQEGRTLSLLPRVLPEFHCGRFIGVNCNGQGTLDMEWTKKKMRQMAFRPQESGEWVFRFPKDLRHYRLRQSSTDRGTVRGCEDPLILEKGQDYRFDKFEK